MLYYWRFAVTIQHSVRCAVLPTTSQNSNFVIGARLLKLILQLNQGCPLMVGTFHILFSCTCVQCWYSFWGLWWWLIACMPKNGRDCLKAIVRNPSRNTEPGTLSCLDCLILTQSTWQLLILCIIFFWVSYLYCLLPVLTQILIRHCEGPLAECMGSR